MIGVLTFIGARLIASNKCFELIESGAPIWPEKRAAGRVATGSCVNVTPHLGAIQVGTLSIRSVAISPKGAMTGVIAVSRTRAVDEHSSN